MAGVEEEEEEAAPRREEVRLDRLVLREVAARVEARVDRRVEVAPRGALACFAAERRVFVGRVFSSPLGDLRLSAVPARGVAVEDGTSRERVRGRSCFCARDPATVVFLERCFRGERKSVGGLMPLPPRVDVPTGVAADGAWGAGVKVLLSGGRCTRVVFSLSVAISTQDLWSVDKKKVGTAPYRHW